MVEKMASSQTDDDDHRFREDETLTLDDLNHQYPLNNASEITMEEEAAAGSREDFYTARQEESRGGSSSDYYSATDDNGDKLWGESMC